MRPAGDAASLRGFLHMGRLPLLIEFAERDRSIYGGRIILPQTRDSRLEITLRL